MNIIYPLHATGFYTMKENYKKEEDTSGEEVPCAILYLEKSDKARFSDLKKRAKNNYVLKRRNT